MEILDVKKLIDKQLTEVLDTREAIATFVPDRISYTTTAPTANNTRGLKFVVLSSEPATKYSGWIYLIKES